MRPVLLCLTEVAAASLGQQQALLPHQHSKICHQDPSLVWQHGYVGTHGDRAAAHSRRSIAASSQGVPRQLCVGYAKALVLTA